VLVCSERKVLLAVVGGRFVVREKYCWLVADKPNEQGVNERKYFTDQFEKTAYTLPYTQMKLSLN
jgi:hypothetical protein